MGDFAIVVTGIGASAAVRVEAERLVNELTKSNVTVRHAEVTTSGASEIILPKAPV